MAETSRKLPIRSVPKGGVSEISHQTQVFRHCGERQTVNFSDRRQGTGKTIDGTNAAAVPNETDVDRQLRNTSLRKKKARPWWVAGFQQNRIPHRSGGLDLCTDQSRVTCYPAESQTCYHLLSHQLCNRPRPYILRESPEHSRPPVASRK